MYLSTEVSKFSNAVYSIKLENRMYLGILSRSDQHIWDFYQ